LMKFMATHGYADVAAMRNLAHSAPDRESPND